MIKDLIKLCSCIKYIPNVKGPIKVMILVRYLLLNFIWVKNNKKLIDCIIIGIELILLTKICFK